MKSNLAQHSKTCRALKKKKEKEESLEEARRIYASANEFSTDVPALQRLETEPFEDCFYDFMKKKATLTKNNYVRHVRGFFRYYAIKCPAFDVKHLFTRLTESPENAVVLQAHHIRSYGDTLSASMANNMGKAMTLFMLLYKDYVVSKYAEVDPQVMERAKANIDHAGTILLSITKSSAVDARAQMALNRESKRVNQFLDSQPRLVRLYCRL